MRKIHSQPKTALRSPSLASPVLSPAQLAIEQALRRTMDSHRSVFDRLPVPVRLRASGALDAWRNVFRMTGQPGATLSAHLADSGYAPMLLLREVREFIATHGTLNLAMPDVRVMVTTAVNSMLTQAFWARQGMLYEPTDALQRLLDLSDIGSDVPLGLVRLPAPALCLIPEASARSRDGAPESVMVFEHGGPPGCHPPQRWLTFATSTRDTSPRPVVGSDLLHINIDDGAKTIEQALANVPWKDSDPEGLRDHWRQVLSYVTKALLYLSLEHVPVEHERPYSSAPRQFPGLGQRKREERLAAIEQLYDRYLIGPAVMAEVEHRQHGDGQGHSVSPHWRRGHFRMQPFGPAASQRKLIFVMPMIVRADRLSGD